jgi:hypothetical protein
MTMPRLTTDEKLFIRLLADPRTPLPDRTRALIAMQRSRPSRFTHLVLLSGRYMQCRMRAVSRDL